MTFNSIEFAIFLPVVFLLYWIVFDLLVKHNRHQLKLQNLFVLLASYLFYGWWDWRFLVLIIFTSFCSWVSGIWMQQVSIKSANGVGTEGNDRYAQSNRASKTRKIIAASNIVINLLILCIFKYYNFFVTEFAKLFSISQDFLLLKIILPVGISFYTFQALSYSIDVYKGKLKPTKDIIAFFTYIAFFPQLVAGPIERATNLLPQFLVKRKFDYALAADGMRQILWGLFKKIAVADNCAVFVNHVFSTYTEQTGCNLLLAAILFTFQIYGDFSGYSDIAIGTSKLFGIRLMQNFKTPYFSRDIAEFWRRWHISLTTWFRDYVYIPLGGSRVSKDKVVRNTFAIFLISGLWHGAGWTFIAWGAYHATLFLPLILTNKNRKYLNQVASGRSLPNMKEIGQMATTFFLVLVGWILFRSESISQFWNYLCGMWQWGTLRAAYRCFTMWEVRAPILLALLMLVVEWIQRNKEHGLQIGHMHWAIRYPIYIIFIIAIIFFYSQPVTFIYFQF